MSGIRRGLVIVQFVLSIVFIVFTMVVSSHVEFIQTQNLGIKKENIVYHFLNGITQNTDVYKNELLSIPGVSSIVFTDNIANGNLGVSWKGKPENEDMYFNVLQVGQGIVETFDLDLLEGKVFPKSYNIEADKYFIINEAAAELIATEDPIGMNLRVWGSEGQVIGLVRNFHHHSFEYAIEPMVMLYNPEQTFMAYIGIETGDVPKVMGEINKTYTKYESDYPFSYTFVEGDLKKSNGQVITVGKLANGFSFAVIFISCLGLFGLSAFITEQRTKEQESERY